MLFLFFPLLAVKRLRGKWIRVAEAAQSFENTRDPLDFTVMGGNGQSRGFQIFRIPVRILWSNFPDRHVGSIHEIAKTPARSTGMISVHALWDGLARSGWTFVFISRHRAIKGSVLPAQETWANFDMGGNDIKTVRFQ